MNLYSQPLLLSLWIAIMIAQGYTLAILIGRKAYREYPAFTICRAIGEIQHLAFLYFASYHPSLYLPVRWGAYPLDLITTTALVLEVFYRLFHPLQTLPKRTIPHFLQATSALILIAVGFAIRFPGAQPTAWMTFARAMDQVVSWVLCGAFGFIVIFAKYFGVPWRHRVFGIAAGYLMYLGIDVAVATVVAQFRLPPYSPIKLLDMFSYLLACLIWAYYFAKPEGPRLLPNMEQIKEIRAIVDSHVIAMTGARIDEPSRSDKPWGGQ